MSPRILILVPLLFLSGCGLVQDLFGLLGPALSILTVYSCPALPVFHGYQPLLAVLLFFGVWWLFRHCTRRVYLALVGLQLLLNLGLLLARGLFSGAHF